MAPLVIDPIDDIQLEAIAAELSFFIDAGRASPPDDRLRRRAAQSGDCRDGVRARSAGACAASGAAGARAALLQAIDDENARVRLEAIYALGVIAQPPLAS